MRYVSTRGQAPAVGFTDASTTFYVGDDGYISNNLHPYAGPVFSAGADAKFGILRVGGELYGAPGGSSLPDESAANDGDNGSLYTARFRVAVEI